jgi:hypothetical protein
MSLPGLGVILQIILCGYRTYLYFSNRSFAPSPLATKWALIFEEANNVQLGLAIVYCFVGLTKIHQTDAFHLRYLVDQAILSTLSKTQAMYIVYCVKGASITPPRKTKLGLWTNIILHSMFIILYLATGIVFELKLKAFWSSDPACFQKIFYSDTMGVGILLGTILILIQVRCMFPRQATTTTCISILWSWSWTIALGILSPVLIVVIVALDIINYEAAKMYLQEPESEWGIGQVLPPLFLGVIIVGLVYRVFWEDANHEGKMAL